MPLRQTAIIQDSQERESDLFSMHEMSWIHYGGRKMQQERLIIPFNIKKVILPMKDLQGESERLIIMPISSIL